MTGAEVSQVPARRRIRRRSLVTSLWWRRPLPRRKEKRKGYVSLRHSKCFRYKFLLSIITLLYLDAAFVMPAPHYHK